MKPIIIKESNKARIEKYLSEKQGKATVRLVDYEKLVEIVKHLDEKLSFLTKKSREGLVADVEPFAHVFPASYKYRPEGSGVLLIYERGLWRLNNVYRCGCDHGGSQYKLFMPDHVRRAVLEAVGELRI